MYRCFPQISQHETMLEKVTPDKDKEGNLSAALQIRTIVSVHDVMYFCGTGTARYLPLLIGTEEMPGLYVQQIKLGVFARDMQLRISFSRTTIEIDGAKLTDFVLIPTSEDGYFGLQFKATAAISKEECQQLVAALKRDTLSMDVAPCEAHLPLEDYDEAQQAQNDDVETFSDVMDDLAEKEAQPSGVDAVVSSITDRLSEADRKKALADLDEQDQRLVEEATSLVRSTGKPSISLIQRQLQVGYNRAARLMESLERSRVVSAVDDKGHRSVLPWSLAVPGDGEPVTVRIGDEEEADDEADDAAAAQRIRDAVAAERSGTTEESAPHSPHT